MGTIQPADHFITIQDASAHKDGALFLDVRKPRARGASGKTIPMSQYCHPFDALNWLDNHSAALEGKEVVVFCVHGHEVSQAVCGFLRDEGVEAVYLKGGFEAWRAANFPTSVVEGIA